MNLLLAMLVALVVTACAGDPTVVYKEVNVPVVVPCVTSSVDKPIYPLQEASGTEGLFNLTKKALSEIELRKAYEEELEALITACKK